MTRAAALLLGLGMLLGATPAWADPPRPTTASVSRPGATPAPRGPRERTGRRAAARTPPPPPTLSVGFANNGGLMHGRRLEEGPSVRYLPNRPLHWGTDELVGLLQRVARSLHGRFALKLTVGDLSAREGGLVGQHRSHQSGRDADLAFFMRAAPARGSDRPGRNVDPDDYYIFTGDGRSLNGAYVFDDARNWALVAALLTDRTVRIERIFVSSPLRARLLRQARAVGASDALVNLAANTLVQPANVQPHNNHFHVRIACPDGDRQCRDGVWARPPARRRQMATRTARTTTRAAGARPSAARRPTAR